jgi:hypothetical protein
MIIYQRRLSHHENNFQQTTELLLITMAFLST